MAFLTQKDFLKIFKKQKQKFSNSAFCVQNPYVTSTVKNNGEENNNPPITSPIVLAPHNNRDLL